jgi:enamine deaminase RidA (YjgF/YER057c/UK114 family)
MSITRLPGTAPGRRPAVAFRDLVCAVAVSQVETPSMREQTASALQRIEERLRALGSDKSRLLQATVYVADMARKAEMNDAWLAWVDPGNEPQRACVGVALEGWHLVEIVVWAARREPAAPRPAKRAAARASSGTVKRPAGKAAKAALKRRRR